MDVKFLNCPTAMPQEPQIDWMELAAQMAMPKPPPSLSGSSLSSAYNSPPTPTSPPFSNPPLSRPPSNPNHASATTEPLFAAGQYFYIPTDGWEPAEAMREMIFCIAAMQPVHIDPESVKPPKRRNVRVSKDPQSVAARLRRERISERIRILQRLVPGGTRMDTASMLDEAIHYVKFLKMQLQSLERAANGFPPEAAGAAFASGNYGWVALDQGYGQVEEPRYGFQC